MKYIRNLWSLKSARIGNLYVEMSQGLKLKQVYQLLSQESC